MTHNAKQRTTTKSRSESIVGSFLRPPIQRGPSGYLLTYTKDGDMVEWVPDEHFGEVFAIIRRRGDDAIHAAKREYLEKVWWNRIHTWLWKVESGRVRPSEGERRVLEYQKARSKVIEREYGRENLGSRDEFDWGMQCGRLSALAWVLGAEWEDSLDLPNSVVPSENVWNPTPKRKRKERNGTKASERKS